MCFERTKTIKHVFLHIYIISISEPIGLFSLMYSFNLMHPFFPSKTYCLMKKNCLRCHHYLWKPLNFYMICKSHGTITWSRSVSENSLKLYSVDRWQHVTCVKPATKDDKCRRPVRNIYAQIVRFADFVFKALIS
jgi:hypothetical protein